MLIVFEGIDGTGKSTQVQLLAKALEGRGHTVVTSYEPTNGPIGKKLRESMIHGRLSPIEELGLFHDDRRDHVQSLIAPALSRGEDVILDRYYFSTMAYQGARGFDASEIREKNESFAPVPDLVILMEVPISVAIERIGARDGSTNTFEKKENLQACDAIFRTLTDPFIHRVDATQPPEAIHLEILEIVLNPSPHQ